MLGLSEQILLRIVPSLQLRYVAFAIKNAIVVLVPYAEWTTSASDHMMRAWGFCLLGPFGSLRTYSPAVTRDVECIGGVIAALSLSPSIYQTSYREYRTTKIRS